MEIASAMNDHNIFRYLRLPIKEVTGTIITSSNDRAKSLEKYGRPKTKNDVIQMLGDQSGKKFNVFENDNTLSTGIGIQK